MTVASDVRREIEKRLAGIERRFQVEVFYACESGSRAWDFASADSDHDVRFLYVHPRDWYLSLVENRDVIEEPIDGVHDINGWDLRKALRLGAKGNPVLFEWLSSPIRYVERPLAMRFRQTVLGCFDPARAYHHYFKTARDQVRAHLGGPTVRHKKYFYALRPLLACLFLLEHGTAVPMRFGELLDAAGVPPAVRQAVSELLDAKRQSQEAAFAPRIPALDRWIDDTVAKLQSVASPPEVGRNVEPLDAFFRSVIAV